MQFQYLKQFSVLSARHTPVPEPFSDHAVCGERYLCAAEKKRKKEEEFSSVRYDKDHLNVY